MPCDTPPPSDTDEIEKDFIADDEFLFEIIDSEDIEDAQGNVLIDHNADDESIATFCYHTDAVFCCSLDKTGNFASSGGEDDKAYVWDPRTGTLVFECTGHTESVIAAVYNHDSSMIATADMNGLVQAWQVSSGAKIWDFEASEIQWLQWHHTENILLAGTADGDCWKWSVPDGATQMFQSYGSCSTCGSIMPDDSRCVVGYDDGTVRFWDLNQASVLGTLAGPIAHKSTVTSIACHQDSALVLTSSVDGFSKLVRSSNCKVLWDMKCSGENSDASVETAGFLQSQPWIATGANDGNLCIWDISTKVQRSSCNLQSTIVKLICDHTSPVLYTGTSDGVISLFDARSAQVVRKWSGHTSGILDFTLSRDGERIVSCSEDSTCKVFQMNQS